MSHSSSTLPEALEVIKEDILTKDITILARGRMLFNKDGLLITEDKEDEYIPTNNPPSIIETEYAQELSWLVSDLVEKLHDVVIHFNKHVFFDRIAGAANIYLAKNNDLTGLLMTVLLEASIMSSEMMLDMNQTVRSQLLACAGDLSDLAERI